ncbi:MAG: NUDIX hydrolase [Phycisphaerae bacterium]|nr:NUDIX hydrolase [Phycisphaerae bacterium]MDW8261976.1 NUDIX hydrolase [Phycisphaerales bacterium]
MSHSQDQLLGEGKYLRLLSRDTWEFAQRIGARGVVGIIAVTPQRKLLLVEQYRRAVNARVIEVPAGLAGDTELAREEALAEAARRELIEETGYDADRFTLLARGPSSAGLTDEIVVLYRAEGLRRVSGGGGDASEQITVLEVPVDQLADWLRARTAEGRLIDFKAWAALAFIRD